jgi:uncharacterized protein
MSGSDSPSRPARLVPDEPLPPYSYVTGRFPHPTRDPRGHSFGHSPPRTAPVDPSNWPRSRAYLLGCDLFNLGYYWEAHETWEGLWHACGRRGATADFLKGLIKLAAAGVKAREGRPQGVVRHAARAAELFTSARAMFDDDNYLGLDLDWLISIARRLELNPISPPHSSAAVEVLFDFDLLPRK